MYIPSTSRPSAHRTETTAPGTIRAILIGGALSVAACAEQPSPPSTQSVRLFRDLSISERLSREYMASLPGVNIQLVGEPGSSLLTVKAIQEARADVGFALADVVYLAHAEESNSPRRGPGTLRGIAALNVTPIHLVARRGLRIADVTQLRGLLVRTGVLPTGTAALSDLVFRAFGVKSDTVLKTHSNASIVDEFVNGTTDATFFTAYYPSRTVEALAGTGAHLVPIDGPMVEGLIREYPFFKAVTIPAATYQSQHHAVRTIGVDFLFICRSDLESRLVYNLTKHFLAALPKIALELGTSLQLTDVDLAPATPIPLHTGAAQYYREWELTR
jgi:uncharacterized protein